MHPCLTENNIPSWSSLNKVRCTLFMHKVWLEVQRSKPRKLGWSSREGVHNLLEG